MRKILTFTGLAFVLTGLVWAGGFHFGEIKDLGLGIEYFDYAYRAPDGTPVYFIGGKMRYQIALNNESNRTFNNFQAQSFLLYAESRHCDRWYYDGAQLEIKADDPLPGHYASGLKEMSMRKFGNASYEVIYDIPWEVCPGLAYIRVTGRHRNQSGKEETASFNIPLNFELKGKK